MRRIHKQQLEPLALNKLKLPFGAEVISVALQGGRPMLWYIFDMEEHAELGEVPRDFYVAGTGQPIPDEFDYLQAVGTCISSESLYVWHVFEVKG